MFCSLRPLFWLLSVLGCAAFLWDSVHAAAPADYLLVPSDRLAALRTELARGGHARAAFNSLVARVREGVSAYSGRSGYARAALAREAAFAWLITRDRAFAETAFQTLKTSRAEDEDQPDRGYGLSRAMMSAGYAFAYDWCREGWSPEQRAEILSTMRMAAEAWPNFQHANVSAEHRGSNWVGVTRGGELLLHLAGRREATYGDRTDRIALCVDDLTRHIATAYGPSGWSQEGLGYLEYTFGFLAPAVFAARDAGLAAPWETLRTRQWHRLLWMALSFREGHDMLQSGVSGPASSDEGMVSLVWLMVPAFEQGRYRWFYDRHLGIEALRPTFDSRRGGSVWALLYYPAAARPEPPDAEPLFDREKGAYYFRNRWRDRDDVLISLITRNDTHSHAWQQPETWAVAIMAFDTTFAGGPGKERAPEFYSQLLIDGRARHVIEGGARQIEATVTSRGGGVVVSDAAGNLGLTTARRRFSVEFPDSNGVAAVIRIDDTLAGRVAFSADWQMRPEAAVSMSALPARDGQPAGFVMRGRSGWLRGWIVSPVATEVTTEELLRVRLSAALEHRLQIVIALGQGQEPSMMPLP